MPPAIASAKPRKDVDSATTDKIKAVVSAALQDAGMSPAKAAKYANFCSDIYEYVVKTGLHLKEVKEGGDKMKQGMKFMNRAKYMGLGAKGFRSYAAGGAGSILAVMVDRYAAIAKAEGIELDECSLSITKVSLDIATAGAGAITALSGWGVVVAFLGVVSTFQDSQALAKACFNT